MGKRIVLQFQIGVIVSIEVYPSNVGLPYGGPGYSPFILLEVHYHNPDRIAGQRDNSGFIFKFIDGTRRFDAGMAELGIEYVNKMAIPPRQLAFQMAGFCTRDCTQLAFPQGGIKIIGSQFHTHSRGKRGFRISLEFHLILTSLFSSDAKTFSTRS